MEKSLSVFKALSDSHRLRAFMSLQGGELCICQIIALLELAPSTVSKHMSILKQAGLVKSRKEGRWIYYCRAESSKVPVKAIVALLSKMLADDTIVKNDSEVLRAIVASDRSDLCLQQKSSKNISDA
jgi:DNA-binding transcriptional ArsR family regulator